MMSSDPGGDPDQAFSSRVQTRAFRNSSFCCRELLDCIAGKPVCHAQNSRTVITAKRMDCHISTFSFRASACQRSCSPSAACGRGCLATPRSPSSSSSCTACPAQPHVRSCQHIGAIRHLHLLCLHQDTHRTIPNQLCRRSRQHRKKTTLSSPMSSSAHALSGRARCRASGMGQTRWQEGVRGCRAPFVLGAAAGTVCLPTPARTHRPPPAMHMYSTQAPSNSL